jgi:hypothetical protein
MANPIEDFLDIAPGSTPELADTPQPTSALIDPETGELVERKTSELTVADFEKEERIEDIHVDAQLSEIHGAAMQAFYQQHTLSQQVDPKFSARNSEVAAQFLTAALNAVNTRIDAKYKRQKIRLEKAKALDMTPSSVQNNIIVADRNSLMQSLFANGGFAQPFVDQLNNQAADEKKQ